MPSESRLAKKNKDWWPQQLDVGILRQHSNLSDPNEDGFDYQKEFQSLDLEAVKQDLHALMTEHGTVPGRTERQMVEAVAAPERNVLHRSIAGLIMGT